MQHDIDEAAAGRRIDQIVKLASKGYTDKEISRELGVSPHTVATHWKRLREKLGVTNRTAAVFTHLRQTIEQQSRELQEANETLQRLYATNRDGLGALLAAAEKHGAELQARFEEQGHHLRYFERASHMAHLAVYDLKSIKPIAHRYASASASTFNHDPGAMKQAETTFYDVIHPDDMALLYEKAIRDATYQANERQMYLYRLLMPEPRWVLDIHQAVYNADDTLAGVLGVVIDVHDLVLAGVLSPVVTRIVVPAEPISQDSYPH